MELNESTIFKLRKLEEGYFKYAPQALSAAGLLAGGLAGNAAGENIQDGIDAQQDINNKLIDQSKVAINMMDELPNDYAKDSGIRKAAENQLSQFQAAHDRIESIPDPKSIGSISGAAIGAGTGAAIGNLIKSNIDNRRSGFTLRRKAVPFTVAKDK